MTDELGLRQRVTKQGEEAIGKLAQELLENPVVTGALSAAFETRERATLSQEPLRDLLVRDGRGVKHLQRHAVPELDVKRREDETHAAFTEQRLDTVLLGDHGPDRDGRSVGRGARRHRHRVSSVSL